MSELDFILGDNEQFALIEEIMADGAVFTPYFAYESPQYFNILDAKSVFRIAQNRKNLGPFFVSWKGEDLHPYEFEMVNRPEGVRYFLKQRHGGPYMDFVASKTIQNEGKATITSGFIAIYRDYWISQTGKAVPASQVLQNRYKKISNTIKRFSRKVHAGSRIYRVGNEAIQLFCLGYSTPVENIDLSGLAREPEIRG